MFLLLVWPVYTTQEGIPLYTSPAMKLGILGSASLMSLLRVRRDFEIH